jgi:hypothetical protein
MGNVLPIIYIDFCQHDNAGLGGSWLLDKVTIENPTGKKWTFKCGRWLAKDEDDKQIERELPASLDDGTTSVTTFIPYQITVITGNASDYSSVLIGDNRR